MHQRPLGSLLWMFMAIGSWNYGSENKLLSSAFVPRNRFLTTCGHTCVESSRIVRSMEDTSETAGIYPHGCFSTGLREKTSCLESQDIPAASPLDYSSRRTLLYKSIVAGSSFLFPPSALAADDDTGLLESRVKGNALNPPPYGMEGTDIFYPR